MPGGGCRANKAAIVSAIYLVVHDAALRRRPATSTGHAFTTIYRDYVRVPPSLSAYPQDDEIEARA